jgi:Na+/proline symporter
LVIGVWGFRRESYSAYLVAEKNMGLPLAVGTFFATYISSATVIGFTGYVTLSGSAVFPTYFWGFALGWVTLLLLAGRMRSLELRTVPELFEVRFQNGSLRSLIAAFIVVSFAFTVMTQLVAGSIVLETIVGIPQLLALVLIAFVLTIYTMLGGLISVIRTDFLQGSLLLIGVLAAFGIVVSRLGSDIFDLDPQQSTWFAGSIGSSWDILAFLLITWGGVSAQPYYLHRFYAAKNVATARQMIGVGAILAGITYVAVAFIGFGLPKLIPEEQLGDSAIPFFALNSGNVMGSLLLIAIICAIQSTVDSALHLTGVYTSEDIIARYRGGMSDRRRLTTARTVTAIFGTICTLTAIYFAISGGPIVELVNLWLGTLSSALLLPLLAALFWPRATAAGAISGSVGGFLAYFGTAVAQFLQVPIAINPIFMGMGASAVLLIVVSMTTTPVSDQSVLHRFFGSGSHTG